MTDKVEPLNIEIPCGQPLIEAIWVSEDRLGVRISPEIANDLPLMQKVLVMIHTTLGQIYAKEASPIVKP